MSKAFLFHHLFNEDGKGLVELLKGEKLNQTLLKFAPLCSLGIRNQIISLKHLFDNLNSLDYISNWRHCLITTIFMINFFMVNMLGRKFICSKCPLMELCLDLIWSSECNGVMICRMQWGDDVQNAWMMFNHVKHVQGCITMACHGYNLIYYKVMTITVYDM